MADFDNFKLSVQIDGFLREIDEVNNVQIVPLVPLANGKQTPIFNAVYTAIAAAADKEAEDMRDEQMRIIQNTADEFGVRMSEIARQTARAAQSIGGVFMAWMQELTPTFNAMFTEEYISRQARKAVRRERYLRRYKRRGERMKKK